jgi:hypothetical protein
VVNGRISRLCYRPRPLPAAPLVVRCRYLIEVPRPFPVALLIVYRRYFIVALKPFPAAPRRCGSRRRTTRKIYSGTEYILTALSKQCTGGPRSEVPSASFSP